MIDRNFTTATKSQAQVDVGLREYMLKVYNYMATGLGLTGLQHGLLQAILQV